MIPPITRNSQSGAERLPATISPAISARTSPSPVETSHVQFSWSVRINADECVAALRRDPR